LLLTGRAQLEGPPVRGLAFAAAISIQSPAECSLIFSLYNLLSAPLAKPVKRYRSRHSCSYVGYIGACDTQ